MDKIVRFPILLTKPFSDRIDKAVKQSPTVKYKHDWVLEAINEKLEREEQANETV